jgi:hypothetical protein
MRILSLSSFALLSAAPSAALAAASETAEPFVASRDPESRERALECLAQAVYYEARSESDGGQRAVAQVVLNRARHPAYPNSVCGVVYQGSQRITGCQFSFTCDGSLNAAIEPYAWERARRIAAAALGGSVYRPVGLATHYHTTAIRPYWAPSLVPQLTLGAHIFYRRPGSGTVEAFSQAPVGDEFEAAPRASYAVARTGERRATRRARDPYAPIQVREIAVAERPVVYRTTGPRSASASAAAAPRRQSSRAAPARSGPRVTIENGVRVVRG